MQVIRRSKLGETKFKRDIAMAAFLGVGCVVLIIWPVVVLAGGNSGWGAWVLLVVGVAAGAGAVWFGRQAYFYFQIANSEDRLQAILANSLGNDYVYFRDLVLPGTPSVGEIDGVLLGPHGALVFQMENQLGEFICEGDTWYKYTGQKKAASPVTKPLGVATIPEVQERKRLSDSPTWQVIRAAREVKAWLSVRDLPQVPVQPLVVLVRGKVHSAKLPSCPIVEMEALENYLRSKLSPLSRLPASETINNGVVEQIALRLKSGN